MVDSVDAQEWKVERVEGRTIFISCVSWMGFFNFVNSRMLNLPDVVFRGQALLSWPLLPSLDRLLATFGYEQGDPVSDWKRASARNKHLENFKYASRGRRASGAPFPVDDDEWWALGQHYGLATPLLDWTESPFVAAFFAFWEEGVSDSEDASVYMLSRQLVERKVSDLHMQAIEKGDVESSCVRFVRPLADDNARLVNQRGLFSLSPENVCIRSWVSENFSADESAPLICVRIPRSERTTALRSLNRMNINALTLFPDLSGSSSFCNTRLRDRRY
jgi:hypothetical protein